MINCFGVVSIGIDKYAGLMDTSIGCLLFSKKIVSRAK